MSSERTKYENLKYFIESYFNWSMDYTDLEKLIEEFISRELPVYIRGLSQEINIISEQRNWSEIKDFVYLNGRRNLNIKKTQEMIELLQKKLLYIEENTNCTS
ncbi:hypothetical protein [Paenibacillus azoreducens]|uniref:CdiI immunity protein domain-containing protein n=1 Tax=Paenibacillus azoreducens TaxID=116718 RepID=A0A919YAR9_9BACL|nr:hypothetical protein [Paenibacillus azoreducens]GIO47329.1 hypothetical protein J34TS1_20940 [Paenibacillus azoreducens]